MPTYEFRCNKCKVVFEKYIMLSEFDIPQQCECGGDSQRLFPSSFSFINTSENRPIDSIVGADAEKKWEYIYKRKEKRQKDLLKKKIKEKVNAQTKT